MTLTRGRNTPSIAQIDPSFVVDVFKPTARQRQIWAIIGAAPPYSRTLIGYGGAAGGGKTRADVEVAYDLALEFPGNKILIARKDFSDLRGTTMEQFDMHVPPDILVYRNNQENVRHIRKKGWPKGVVSVVKFRELKDYMGLGSEEFGAVIIDEAGEVPTNSALMLLSRLRWKLPPVIRAQGFHIKYLFLASSNPWPGWFKEWFVDRSLPEATLKNLDASVHFVPALARDNPHLDPGYEDFLRTIYPVDWVKRLMDGDWEVFFGQVYPSFNPETHAWKFVDPVSRGPLIPPFTRLIGGLDFGEPDSEAHPTAGIVAGVMKSGRILRLAEFLANGTDVTQKLVQWMAAQEHQWSSYVIRDPYATSPEPNPRVLWCADHTQMAAINLMKAHFAIRPSKGGPNTVRWGITLVANALQIDPNTKHPGSYYLPHLTHFKDAMIRYRWPEWDKAKPAPTTPLKVDDDLNDADRYMHELTAGQGGDPGVYYKNQLPGYDYDDDMFTRGRTDNPLDLVWNGEAL